MPRSHLTIGNLFLMRGHMEIFLPASPNATQEPHLGALAFFPSSKRLIDYWPTESFDPLLKI